MFFIGMGVHTLPLCLLQVRNKPGVYGRRTIRLISGSKYYHEKIIGTTCLMIGKWFEYGVMSNQ